MKNIKYIGIIPIFILSMISPSFSDTLSNNSQCDNATLHTTTGPATLNARWTANTIILNWQPGDDATFTAPAQNDAAYSCEYDGGITLPTAPTRSGYTFGGWRVGAAAAQCVLSQHYVAAMDNEEVDWDPQYIKWEPIAQNGYTMAEAFEDENLTSGLSAGEWSVTFPNGELRGHAVCTNIAPNNLNNLINVDSQTLVLALYGDNGSGIIPYATFNKNDNTGGYCWCAGTDFGNSCSVTPSSWVLGISNSDSMSMSKDECMSECSGICVLELVGFNIIAYRRAIFDVAGE